MHVDVNELKAFYYRSALGRAAQSAIRAQMLHMWDAEATKGQTVVGFGFANPLLRPFRAHARRVISLMPAAQGVMPWPPGEDNVAVLAEETLWPIETGHADRLILLHALDTSDHVAGLLEECYRVLGPGGRALVIVPSRTGLWARKEGTPFFFSRPFTTSQLETRLLAHGLKYERCLTALYQPPWDTRFWLKAGPTIERAGQSIPAWRGGGVLLMEVSKQVPRPQRPGLGIRAASPLSVLDGVRRPEPSLNRS